MYSLPDLQRPQVLLGMWRASAIAIVIVLSFSGVDYVLLEGPEHTRFVRCVIARIILAAACAIFNSWCSVAFQRSNNWREDRISIQIMVIWGIALYVLVGLGMIYIMYQAGGAESSYFVGLIMVFSGIAIMTPWPPKYSLSIFTFLTAIFFGSVFTKTPMVPPSTKAFVHIVFLVSSGVLSWYGNKILFELQKPDPYENAFHHTNRRTIYFDLTITFFPISLSVLLLFAISRQGAPPASLPPENSLYPVQVIAPGAPDQSFEFINRTGMAVTLRGAQFVLNGGSYTRDILAPDAGARVISRDETVRIYAGTNLAEYHLNATNLVQRVDRENMRIYGFRLAVTNDP